MTKSRLLISELIEDLLLELESDGVPEHLRAGYGAIAQLMRPILDDILCGDYTAWPSFEDERRLNDKKRAWDNKKAALAAIQRARQLASQRPSYT